MRLLGVDPGSHVTGYGVIDCEPRVCAVDYGCIRPSAKASFPKRLAEIYDQLAELIVRHQIDAVCVEEAFYAKNVKTTLILGHARGVILLAAENARRAISEYSPREIKKSVTGNGAASKEQVQFMVQQILSLKKPVEPLDSADALAVALCHAQRSRMKFA